MKCFSWASSTMRKLPHTLALSDQPKDCTVTSRRFNSIFLLISYSFTSAWLMASIFSWKRENVDVLLFVVCSLKTFCFLIVFRYSPRAQVQGPSSSEALLRDVVGLYSWLLSAGKIKQKIQHLKPHFG